ncbi:MAG: hypothetical protein IH940_09730 [Acidobacteria bacterium]|nr:hypothetical protein [Acidobacteriota bacterium]
MPQNSEPETLEPLKRRMWVVAANDLPGIPSGTRGRVLTVVGFRWVRHRVTFDNGVERGSISREDLATPAEFAKRLEGDAA